jgi:hypothetical protein
MIYIHLILAGVGSLLNYVYFRKIKTSYRWIKLSYTINLFLIFVIHLSAILLGESFIHETLEAAMITLLLATIIGGSIVSSAKAGINMFPKLGFSIKIEKREK